MAPASPAFATGGHFAIEDGYLADEGACEADVWYERGRSNARSLGHVGAVCRVSAVEVGLAVKRSRSAGEPGTWFVTPQLKWATEIVEGVGAGIGWAALWQDGRPHFAGQAVYLPLTWQMAEPVSLHVNVGRFFAAGGPDATIGGAAFEWTATPAWTFIGEHIRDEDRRFWRAGMRFLLAAPRLTFDLSYTRPTHGSAGSWWTFGVNLAFAR